MATSDTCCSLVPYFKVAPGQLPKFRSLCEQFVAKTQPEPSCLYYGFSFLGDHVHCREGYRDADGVLAHLANVDAILREALTIAERQLELIRIRDAQVNLMNSAGLASLMDSEGLVQGAVSGAAMLETLRQLFRWHDYERKILSRRKRAMRAFHFNSEL